MNEKRGRKLNQTYHYTECGLDNVYLCGGIEYVNGPHGKQVIIRDIDGLHKIIGSILVNEKRDLSGKELRFLRHEMLMSQATLAKLLDVADQTVHRWEAGKTEVPKPAEALIRLLFNEHLGNNEKIKASLKRIAELEDVIDQKRLTLIEGKQGWQLEPRRAA
ncbi:MAG: transcriptional regulator [Alphaproteobacteria bacterium]|nr:transcriptional regulator [Alphaproteobacteria bacterium]